MCFKFFGDKIELLLIVLYLKKKKSSIRKKIFFLRPKSTMLGR